MMRQRASRTNAEENHAEWKKGEVCSMLLLREGGRGELSSNLRGHCSREEKRGSLFWDNTKKLIDFFFKVLVNKMSNLSQ